MMRLQRAGVKGIHTSPAIKQPNRKTANLAAGLLLMLVTLMLGCTTLQPMADNPESLRNELRSGKVVKPGDKVSVVTRDGLTRLLIVTALDKSTLKGHPEGKGMESEVIAIPIDDIVHMEQKRFSVAKTAAYTGGVGVVLFLVIGAIAAAVMVPM